jgi:hypothetical protein
MVYAPTYPSTYTIWFTSWTFLFLCEQNLSLKIAIRCQIDDQQQGQLPEPTQTFELMREKDHVFHLRTSLTACSNGVKHSHPEFKELLVELTGVKVIISHRLLLTAKTILVTSFSIFDHHVYHWLIWSSLFVIPLLGGLVQLIWGPVTSDNCTTMECCSFFQSVHWHEHYCPPCGTLVSFQARFPNTQKILCMLLCCY